MRADIDKDKLRDSVKSAVKKIEKAKKDKPTLAAQTVFVGVLGVMFILPVVVGAYLGHWLDCKMTGYSVGWTISLILVGIFIGAVNVYLFVRE